MAIAYSGGPNVYNTFTQSTGTRREIVDGISSSLVSANWTIISGSGTGDQILQSGTPLTGQGSTMKMRVRLYDPGSGNCAQITWRSQTGYIGPTTAAYLFPQAGKIWNVVACPYQAFVFTNTQKDARGFAAWGVLNLPTFLQGIITEGWWGHSNSYSDSDTTLRKSFRISPMAGTGGNSPNQSVFINGAWWDLNGSYDGTRYMGVQALSGIMAGSLWYGTGFRTGSRWHNEDYMLQEPLIAWSMPDHTKEGKYRGQLWDAVVSSDYLTIHSSFTFDGHNWKVVGNWTTTNQEFPQGSLLLVTS